MLPVDSTARTGEVNGAQLQKWLEKELNNVFAKNAEKRFGGWLVKLKGMEITFSAFAEEGLRIQSITISGKPLKSSKIYTVLACETEDHPEDMLCRMKNVQNAHNTNSTLHSVLKAYLKSNSPVTPTPPLTSKILDAPQTLLSQITGVDYRFT